MEQATKEDVAPLECLMCGGRRHRPIFNESGIDILRCRDCSHVFSSFAGDPHYTGFWGEEVEDGDHFYWKPARARMYQDFFERFLVGRSGRLLDMGCGLGFFLKAMAPYATWEAYGCEISPAAAQYARQTLGLNLRIHGHLRLKPRGDQGFDRDSSRKLEDQILLTARATIHFEFQKMTAAISAVELPLS